MRAWIVVVAACALCGCKSESPEPAAEPAAQAVVAAPAPSSDVRAQPQPVEPAPKVDSYTRVVKPGWSTITLHDKVPFCLFESFLKHYEAPNMKAVKKPKLRAKAKLVFGAFAPACVSDACDERPTLECSVDREGSTLTVHTRYIVDHKDGTTCTDQCKTVTAGCETPELESGTYQIIHGEKTFKLRVPSVLRDPCFEMD